MNQLTFRLDNSFENFKQRFFSFNSDETKELLKVDGEKLLSFYVVDQIGKKRFLNSYLSKLTIKGFKFDMSKYNDEIKKMIDEY